MGSSPRVRSRLQDLARVDERRGIISACAEQTDAEDIFDVHVGDHLRVCGADSFGVDATNVNKGSSPRVRSRP